MIKQTSGAISFLLSAYRAILHKNLMFHNSCNIDPSMVEGSIFDQGETWLILNTPKNSGVKSSPQSLRPGRPILNFSSSLFSVRLTLR